jgi:hypothetical protein
MTLVCGRPAAHLATMLFSRYLRAPGTITLASNNTGVSGGNQDVTLIAFENVTIGFHWIFSTVDTGTGSGDGNQWDPFG